MKFYELTHDESVEGKLVDYKDVVVVSYRWYLRHGKYDHKRCSWSC